MGNWRTVNIIGKMSPEDAKKAINFLSSCEAGYGSPCECLCISKSMCGLNKWINEDGTIDACGNLSERDFENEDIETALKFIANKYPSTELILHSGSDWESLICSATFHVRDGVVTMVEPEIEELQPVRVCSIFDLI